MPTAPVPYLYPASHNLNGTEFICIDAHTCGNPVRVVAAGGPALKGNTMSEKRQHFLREFDWIRKGLMFEPRGFQVI
ncbi:MAG: proline racemase family protein [Chitinophagaceae bacterium]|nr:proline racemase family protein [Chitinophagaceae bacterium]